MFSLIKNHPKAVLWAIIVNIVFLGAMGVSFHFIDAPTVSMPEVKVIKATLKDDSIAQQKLKRKLELKRRKELKRKKEKQRQVEIKRKKLKLAELKKKKQAMLAAKKKREQQQAEKKRIVEENQKQIAAENRRIKEEQQRKQREDKLKKELEEEQRRLTAEREARNETIISRQRGIIKAHIEQRWIKPTSARVGVVCVVNITLIPSGEVINVRYIKRSGNSAFDQSVYRAIKRASPLPLPPIEYGLSDKFREIQLTFGKPK